MTEPIIWTNETRKLSDLIPWDVNPRQLTEKQAEHLQKSLRKFGLAQPFLISPDDDIYDGHQRTKLMDIMKEWGHDADIDCRMSSRILTDDERRELVIRLHENTGEWDWDMVPNLYEVKELGDWGMPEWKIGNVIQMEFSEGGGDALRNLDTDTYSITPVLAVDDISTFERAIVATGERNRGKALIKICKAFLDEHKEGQFDFSFEG